MRKGLVPFQYVEEQNLRRVNISVQLNLTLLEMGLGVQVFLTERVARKETISPSGSKRSEVTIVLLPAHAIDKQLEEKEARLGMLLH